jgi:predicted peroxiredoxin
MVCKMQKTQRKVTIWAFRGDPMCIVHIFLNALNMYHMGYSIKIVIEGEATSLIKTYHNEKEKAPFYDLYKDVKDKGLIDAVCRACSTKMGSIKEVKAESLPLIGSLNGHPSMSSYIETGYQIITL